MAKLDKSRPYAEHFGENSVGKYSQDGKLFDRNGDEMTPKETAAQAKANVTKMAAIDAAMALASKPKESPLDPPINRQVAAQLAE